MGRVVHFEAVGKDGDKLRDFYGKVAIDFAVKYPERVASVTLFRTNPGMGSSAGAPGWSSLAPLLDNRRFLPAMAARFTAVSRSACSREFCTTR